MLKIYYKPNCHTCRIALQHLKDHCEQEIETTEYLVDIPSEQEIKDLLKLLNIKAKDLVRKKEPLYKEKYEGKKISNARWIKILHKNPILIERPIVLLDDKAIIGRPPESIIPFITKYQSTKKT